jgi:hypothetical protein
VQIAQDHDDRMGPRQIGQQPHGGREQMAMLVAGTVLRRRRLAPEPE